MLGLYHIKPRFQQALSGLADGLVARRVHPDRLTAAALGLALLGGAALVGARWVPPLLLAVPPLVLARTALNALDGMVARRGGWARPWGEVLNESSDRLADVALFAGVALAPGAWLALGAAVLVAMLLVSYVGTVARAAGGHRQYGGPMGKADRMLYLGIAAPLAFVWPGVPVFGGLLALMLGGLVLTAAGRLRASYVDLQPPR
jgi:CDP-diacylglycerol--glycerol-3-phosphate 3-phosphatidyltransferase